MRLVEKREAIKMLQVLIFQYGKEQEFIEKE